MNKFLWKIRNYFFDRMIKENKKNPKKCTWKSNLYCKLSGFFWNIDLEFKQIMEGAGYKLSETNNTQWIYQKNKDFSLQIANVRNYAILSFAFYVRANDSHLKTLLFEFENISQMNSIEFKKKLEGLTDYAYSLYMDINRHIDALSIKMETKAKSLGM